jgi:lysozyme
MRSRHVSAIAAAVTLFSAGCEAPDTTPKPRERTAEAMQAACDFGSGVPGLDVSTYQGTVDWPTVAADGWRFAIARIGHYDIDDQFAANWPGIKAAGMVRGGYWYFEPEDDPLAQAQIVVDAIGPLGPGDLPVTCDVESEDYPDPASYAVALATWMDAVEEGTGKRPMIYTRASYWDPYVNSGAFSDSALWVAHYTTTQCPNVPQDWQDWTFWQWTDSGQVPGMPQASAVDQNWFRGTEEQLLALAGSAGGSYAATLDGIDMPTAVLAGETFGVSVTFTNSGDETWDASTFLGTSDPRDRASDFEAPTWATPNRPVGVGGTVPPGATYAFDFELVAPDAPGAYAERFALVQEGVTWFADAGGPSDDAVHLSIQVVANDPAGPGVGGGAPGDGGASGDDDGDDDGGGGSPRAAAGAGGTGEDAGGGEANGAASDEGCAVGAPGQPAASAGATGAALLLGAVAWATRARRRRATGGNT